MDDESQLAAPVIPRTRASLRSNTGTPDGGLALDRSRRGREWRAADRASTHAAVRSLGAVLVAGGMGILLASVIPGLSVARSGLLSTVTLWAAMLVAVVYSLAVLRAHGLFRMRFEDVILGVGGAVLLRLLGGVAGGANDAPFPTMTGLAEFSPSWFLQVALPPALVGPIVEELFFRAVLVVALYQLLAPRVGRILAGAASSLVSAGTFVLLHVVFTPFAVDGSLQLLALGLACSILVLCTGRIAAALLLHVAYNTMFLMLAVVGAVLA